MDYAISGDRTQTALRMTFTSCRLTPCLRAFAGEIQPSDYPQHLANSGHRRVSVTFTVTVTGRAAGCRVTRSSGIGELDGLTCRLIEQRFRFRPSTDRFGHPIAEDADLDQDWIPPRDR